MPAENRTAPSLKLMGTASAMWPLVALCITLALQLSMVWTRTINWDEFFYFSEVQYFAGGELARALQTIHVRIFAWLTWLPSNSVNQIIAGRIVMFICEIITCGGIALLARRFVSNKVALLCALAYLSAGFVLQHGFSFRTDPLAAALLMSALVILCRTSLRIPQIIAFGALTGLAVMVTIKVALYLPAFAGIAWLRWRDSGNSSNIAIRIVAAAICGLSIAALIYVLHETGVSGNTGQTQYMVKSSARKMFSFGVQPYWFVIPKAVAYAVPLTVMILSVPVFLFDRLRPITERIALAGLFAPILSLAFFHNTAPYFYAFILPPVVVACACVMERLLGRYNVLTISALLLFNVCLVWALEGESRISKQRVIVEQAQKTFPSGTTYFDCCGMVPVFSKANGFMTPWGLESYRLQGLPYFKNTMKNRPVPLIIENDQNLTELLRTRNPSGLFVPEDAQAIRSTYVNLWGPLWIAGQNLEAGEARRVDLLVPGPYAVRHGVLAIDGTQYQPGTVVQLERGDHDLVAQGNTSASIIWGANTQIPDVAPPVGEIWTLF